MDDILEYEKLVYSVVKKFQGSFDIEDLKQVGMMGLIKAYKNFNEGFDTKFSTYAYTYILGEVLNYIRNSKVIKINKEMQSLYRKILQIKEFMTQKLMREPTNFEIACYLEIDEKQVEDAILANEFVKSLDYAINEDDENKELSMYDVVSFEETQYNPEYLDLKNAIDTLPEQDKVLIYDRYYNDLTQSQVSRKLNTSQVQVSRKEAKILQKLKDQLVA